MSAALQLVEREVDTEELEHDQLVTVYAWTGADRYAGCWDFLGSEVLSAMKDTLFHADGTPVHDAPHTPGLSRIEVVIPEPGSHQAYGWGWRR